MAAAEDMRLNPTSVINAEAASTTVNHYASCFIKSIVQLDDDLFITILDMFCHNQS